MNQEEISELPSELTEIEMIILQRQLQCYHNVTRTPKSIGPDYITGSKPNQTGLFCPRVFDGWACWNETPAGETAYEPCPFFVTGFDPRRFGHKECLSDGTWFRHPDSNVTWSNYTTCVDLADLERRRTVITIHEVGYLVSICALVLSLIIFCSFRCLECTRVRIHKHLFVSFIINNILWLTWYRAVVTQPGVLNNPGDQFWCTTLHIMVQYFLVANYFWMFCEGFYLHTLIVFTFTRAESKLLIAFYLFGWLGPQIPVGLYAVFRGFDSDPEENQECWVKDDTKWKWFLSVPVCVCLLSSLFFLINILRILLNKLSDTRRATSMSARRESGITDSHNAIRKAAKATLILIPLLGLHYLLTPFRPNQGSEGEIIYEYISAVSISFQGLCVSLLFCFCNGEVITVLRRKFCSKYCPGKSSYRGDYSCAPTCTVTNPTNISRVPILSTTNSSSSPQTA